MESRVVPVLLETIDASSRRRKFINDDFPELGFPTTAYVSVLLSAIPSSDFFINISISVKTFKMLFLILAILKSGTSSSSGKFINDSISALMVSISSRIILTSSTNFPLSEF